MHKDGFILGCTRSHIEQADKIQTEAIQAPAHSSSSASDRWSLS